MRRLVLAALALLAGGLAACSPVPESPDDAASQDAGPPAETARPAGAGPITASGLPGHTYAAGPLTIAFAEDGALTLNGDEDGTWTYDDGRVTVEAGDYTYYLQARDDGLYYGEMRLQRGPDAD